MDNVFVDKDHEKAFYDLLSTRSKYDRESVEYQAAIYVITSTEKLRNKFSCYVVEHGIDFPEMRKRTADVVEELLIDNANNLFNYEVDAI